MPNHAVGAFRCKGFYRGIKDTAGAAGKGAEKCVGAARLGLFDMRAEAAEALAGRLRAHYPALAVGTGSRDPAGFDIVVNATPIGMNPDDPLPLDATRIDAGAFVGEVVMKAEETPFLAAAKARGCLTQVGTDMLFEQIPAYLEFFDLPTTTPDELRRLARIEY